MRLGKQYVYSGTKAIPGQNCAMLGNKPPKNADCAHYTHAGTKGPFECKADGFTHAKSFWISKGGIMLGGGTGNDGCWLSSFDSSQLTCQNIVVTGFRPH